MKIVHLVKMQFAFLCMFCLMVSCATQSTYKKLSTLSTEENPSFIDPSTLILVVSPDFDFESIRNEGKLEYSEVEKQLKEHLESRTLAILGDKGFRYKTLKQLADESGNLETELQEILNNSHSMHKAYIDEKLQETIMCIGNKTDNPALMVINCEVKVGSGGSWDPNSGFITSKNHRTLLKGILLNTRDCTKLWSNRVQLRDFPKVGDKAFEEAINSIFANLKPKGE